MVQEASTRQDVSLAEALSKAAFKLNVSRPFDAAHWKISLEAVQSALPKSNLTVPIGKHGLLPQLYYLCPYF